MTYGHDYPHHTEVQFLGHLDILSVHKKDLKRITKPKLRNYMGKGS